MKRINKKVLFPVVTILVIVLIIGGCLVYVSDYYHADLDAITAFSADNQVSKSVVSNGIIVYGDPNAQVGFVFYPGGKVEYTAYEPLMVNLASNGVLCILIKMPFNLAVLDINAANGIPELYPDVEKWFIGGHSLGGSMAASYVSKHIEDFGGIVLLGSYSTVDLSDTSVCALSIFGSEDKVMNREKYDKYKINLPPDLKEIEIEGGCHAFFGMYGKQDGDGVPTISAEEQITLTAEYISEFILKGER